MLVCNLRAFKVHGPDASLRRCCRSVSYPVAMGTMKEIAIRLPEATVLQLRKQARQSGRSVAALVRELVDAPPQGGGSIYAITADLAGSLGGGAEPATNARRRFRRE